MTVIDEIRQARLDVQDGLTTIYSKAVQFENQYPHASDEIRMFIRRLNRVLPKLWNKLDEIINDQTNPYKEVIDE